MGYGTASTASASGVVNIDALISGYKWASTSLTYALPTLASQYSSSIYSSPAVDENGSFQPVTGGLVSSVAFAMAQISAVSGLNITLTANTATATMLVGRTGYTATAHAYLPDTGPSKGGDIWFGLDSSYDAPVRGSYGWTTALHEIGHALGLKHSHTYIGGTGVYEDDVGVISQPVAANRDSVEFTVMSYRSYVNQDLEVFNTYTNEDYGYPQTLMMLDIAALQHMYGADFTINSGNTTYTFSATTGEMFVNGQGQGTPGANRIFLTIWDGGGTDTYDFSNYSSNLNVDLAPGNWSLLSSLQRANLGNNNFASGNVYNALQYQNNAASLIENATGGSGNDSILGNSAANMLIGNGGADTLIGGLGADSLDGGTSADLLIGDGVVAWTSNAMSVQRLYLACFRRAADDGGQVNWTIALDGGTSLTSVAAGFVNSAELQQTYGALNNTQYVTLLYQNVLNRAPDAGGLNSWVSQLNSGASRSDVLLGFSESAEFQIATNITSFAGEVYRLYDSAFNRAADVGGFTGWVDARTSGMALSTMVNGFMASAEFTNTYGSLTNTQFVTLLYNNVLNRAPDSGGLSYWTGQLDTSAQTRAQVLIGFSEGQEHINLMASGLNTFMDTATGFHRDVLTGGSGVNSLTGGRGADTFVFNTADNATTTVYGFEVFDTLRFEGFGFANPAAALAAMSQQGANVVFASQSDTIVFHNTQLATLQALQASDWVFV